MYADTASAALSVTIWQSCDNIHYFLQQSSGTQTSPVQKKLCRLQSRFYHVTTEHDSALILLQMWFQLRIFKVTYVHQCGTVDFLFVSLCFQDDFLLALDFLQLPCWDCLELLPLLNHCKLSHLVFSLLEAWE